MVVDQYGCQNHHQKDLQSWNFQIPNLYWGGVKFNGGIDMGEGGGERDGDLGGDSDLGEERGIWGVVERGRLGFGWWRL